MKRRTRSGGMRGRGTVFRPLFAAAGAYLSLASACMASPAVMPQAAGSSSTPSAQRATWARARIRAAETLRRMTPEEKTTLTIGILAIPFGPDPPPLPAEAVPGAGYVPGIPRLGIPALRETDASLGVGWATGARMDGATALPSGLAQAASFDPQLIRRAGAIIGAEARAKGFNVMLAGGVNLARDPRNGRNFEYLGEDPWLAGTLAGAAVAGIQSNRIISTLKHFALNGQETGRKFVQVKIGEAAARESDLLAFQLGIERGQPGAVMCAYNRVRDGNACASDWLLNQVLKRDWQFPGFVMSDWGAVLSTQAALQGLDQQSGAQLDPRPFLGADLAQAARSDARLAARVDDMNLRILTAIHASGIDREPAVPGGTYDAAAHAAVAREVAESGIVLLRNRNGALPLSTSVRSIAIIGGYASHGVLSGGGSSQVHGEGGPALIRPVGGVGVFAAFTTEQYHRSPPFAAIAALVPHARLSYRDGRHITDAVEKARQADVAIVFANQWASEGYDLPDLSLPDGQDALIEAVAAANPHTIVVLQTGGPVLMPWIGKAAAVLEAWYPGARGGEAIAAVLFGQVNPSGRLPITFPAGLEQLPRPRLDGLDVYEPDFLGNPPTPDAKLVVDYDIEGSDVGYRWNARRGQHALFPFGFGLSYTSFSLGGLATDGTTARFDVANRGPRDGAAVAQLYLVSRDREPKLRLVGYQRVPLAAGASRKIDLQIDPRLLADWHHGGWRIRAGTYDFALGENAETLGPVVSVPLRERRWRD
ncbi:MAG: glycoside hydrolase family 3 C-terminal domain-containing protein [Steroidobacteraceae bacterium]